MAEVLGLVTAIGAILTSGFQVATAISTIVDGLGTAGAQVQAIAVETQTILLTLRSINQHLIEAYRVTTEVANIVEDIITLCRKDIDDIKECMAPLLGKRAEEMLLKHKLRWLFARSKVSTRQASLNSLKLTLGLFLQSLNLTEQDCIEDYMQVVVRQQISESQNVKKAFMEAERRDQALEKTYEPSQSISSPKMIDLSGPAAEKLPQTIRTTMEDIEEIDRDKSVNGTMVKVLHYQSEDGSSDGEGFDLLPSHQSRLDQTNSAISLIDDISDDQFMVIADHLRLQKTVSSFALVVINQRQETGPDGAVEDTPTVVPPSDNLPGAWTTFDSSRNAQQTPGARRGAAGRHTPQSESSEWEPRYPENTAPEYPPPHSGPRRGGSDNPHFGSYPPYPRSTPSPSEFQSPMPDTEKLRLQEELALLRNELAKREEEEKAREEMIKRRELEESIRKDAETAIAGQMEELRKAQEDARTEIEKVKREAEQGVRNAVEAERNAEEQRQNIYQEATVRAEREAKQKSEAELKAAADAQEAKQKYEEELRVKEKDEQELRAAAEANSQSSFMKLFRRKKVDHQGNR
ncbi:unnamed protein product [Colletotrichum noveboracense]|uniref:Fungal N-terminal domain-containing protein n=1 Tax=Colletotrichum noveboracense TaxID=2664923 RepID=A0A9W4RMP1_9PEZI|nr:hypothetical protein K456DRAFT_1765989 [Colletotrichum gloeosporioides 23]CAI0644200.1 unnamed protein product [Colletotrichum noveboracense]